MAAKSRLFEESSSELVIANLDDVLQSESASTLVSRWQPGHVVDFRVRQTTARVAGAASGIHCPLQSGGQEVTVSWFNYTAVRNAPLSHERQNNHTRHSSLAFSASTGGAATPTYTLQVNLLFICNCRPPVASHQRHDELASAAGVGQTNEAGGPRVPPRLGSLARRTTGSPPATRVHGVVSTATAGVW